MERPHMLLNDRGVEAMNSVLLVVYRPFDISILPAKPSEPWEDDASTGRSLLRWIPAVHPFLLQVP
jgi:hypothetical protein